jgi:hypothetical protein
MEDLGQLRFGEIGTERTAEVTESVMGLTVSLTANMTSQLSMQIYDPKFRMMKANYFQIRRPVSYRGQAYEISSASAQRHPTSPDSVQLQCRSAAVQRMRRDKGAANWNTSAAGFAKQMAEKFGLEAFIQSTPDRINITRQSGDNSDESTWDVLQRLANDLEYVVFESYGVLYFSSEEFLIERQPGIVVDADAPENDAWFPFGWAFNTNDDDWKGSTATVLVPRVNGKKLRPGMTVAFKNVGKFGPSETTHQEDVQNLENADAAQTTRKYMIIEVSWSEGNNQPIQIQARTLVETDDTVADSSVGLGVIPYGSRDLCKGVSGTDVKRLQMAIGMPEKDQDGIFGLMTEGYVKTWQAGNKLGIKTETLISDIDPADRHFFGTRNVIVTYIGDGCIDADDWAVLLAVPGSSFPLMEAATEAEDPADIKFFERAKVLAEQNRLKNLKAATEAEDSADRKFFNSSYQPDPYEIEGREALEESEGIQSTIDPADIKFMSGLYSKPKDVPTNHPLYGKYS